MHQLKFILYNLPQKSLCAEAHGVKIESSPQIRCRMQRCLQNGKGYSQFILGKDNQHHPQQNNQQSLSCEQGHSQPSWQYYFSIRIGMGASSM